MARRRYGRRYGRRRSGKSGFRFMGLGTKGLLSLGILGAAAGTLFGEQIGGFVPVVNQQSSMVRGAVGGFIVGGPLGALGNVVKQFATGSTGTSSSSGSVW